jgi:hypothetical protein
MPTNELSNIILFANNHYQKNIGQGKRRGEKEERMKGRRDSISLHCQLPTIHCQLKKGLPFLRSSPKLKKLLINKTNYSIK